MNLTRLVAPRAKATISVELYLNGHKFVIAPAEFTAQDGDTVVVNCEIGLPVVQVPDTVGDVVIVREVIRPVVEI